MLIPSPPASKKNQPKKEKKEKKEQPKKEKKVEEEKPSQEETEANASEKSQKQIMEEWAAGLPKSTLVFDEWKRFYSNNKMPAACKWFWENFDAAGYSLWFCNFKYNDENEQVCYQGRVFPLFFSMINKVWDRVRADLFWSS